MSGITVTVGEGTPVSVPVGKAGALVLISWGVDGSVKAAGPGGVVVSIPGWVTPGWLEPFEAQADSWKSKTSANKDSVELMKRRKFIFQL